jgi:hypothetical protein
MIETNRKTRGCSNHADTLAKMISLGFHAPIADYTRFTVSVCMAWIFPCTQTIQKRGFYED